MALKTIAIGCLALFAGHWAVAGELEGCRPMAETVRLLRPLLETPWSAVSRAQIARFWPKPLALDNCEPQIGECAAFETCHCDQLHYSGRIIEGETHCSDLFLFKVVATGNGRVSDQLYDVALVVSAPSKKKVQVEVDTFVASVGCVPSQRPASDASERCMTEVSTSLARRGRVWSAWIHWSRDQGAAVPTSSETPPNKGLHLTRAR
jgi:hypothetical protein